MSIALQILVKHDVTDLADIGAVKSLIHNTFEKCKKYCESNGYDVEECECRIEEPIDAGNTWISSPPFMINLRPGYWDMITGNNYTDIFGTLNGKFVIREQIFEYVKLLGQTECYLCDEFRMDSWNDYEDNEIGTLENWKRYIIEKEGELPEFDVKKFGNIDYDNFIYKNAYHDNFIDIKTSNMKVKANDEFKNTGVDGLELNIKDFWEFQFSNILMHRGELAEYLVAKALGNETATNDAYWTLCDIDYKRNNSVYQVEVKETSDWHEWNRKGQKTQRVFSIAPAHKNYSTGEKIRNNHVYVFCHHKGDENSSPLDLNNWDFYVIPTKVINQNTRKEQKSISLGRVKTLSCNHVLRFADLKTEIDKLIDIGL